MRQKRIGWGIISLVWIGAFCASAQDAFIFEARFEKDTVGKPPKDWTPTAAGTIEVIESGDPERGRVVRIVDTGSAGGMARLFPEQASGTFSIEYEILKKPGSSGGDVELLYISNDKLGDLTGVDVAMNNGAKSIVKYHNGGWMDGPEIVHDRWHLITCRIDMDKLKWTFEFNEEKIAGNLAFRDFGGKNLNRLNFANILDGGSTFELLLDNLVVYEGVERPVLGIEPSRKASLAWATLKAAR